MNNSRPINSTSSLGGEGVERGESSVGRVFVSVCVGVCRCSSLQQELEMGLKKEEKAKVDKRSYLRERERGKEEKGGRVSENKGERIEKSLQGTPFRKCAEILCFCVGKALILPTLERRKK